MTDWCQSVQSGVLTRRGSLLLLCSWALAGRSLATDRPTPVKVGFLRNYKPFSYRDANGRPMGFDLDVASRLCEILGLRLEPVFDSVENLAERLKRGEIAWMGNQLLTTPENRRRFDFVRPAYASIQLSGVQHEDDERDFLSLEDLLGKRLGVLRHTGMEEQARGALGNGVVAFDRLGQALAALRDRKVDAVLEESLIAEYQIERDDLPLKLGAPMTAAYKVGLGVTKGNKALQSALSEGVAVLLNAGESAQQLLAQFEGTARASQAPERGRMDLRTYGVGVQIIRECGVQRMTVMGTPRRMPSMAGYGLEIAGYITPGSQA